MAVSDDEYGLISYTSPLMTAHKHSAVAIFTHVHRGHSIHGSPACAWGMTSYDPITLKMASSAVLWYCICT